MRSSSPFFFQALGKGVLREGRSQLNKQSRWRPGAERGTVNKLT